MKELDADDPWHPDLIVLQQPECLHFHYQPKHREHPFRVEGDDPWHLDLIVR